jgi:pyruvate formate-lyase activating enzyme-like uncharacterized protein
VDKLHSKGCQLCQSGQWICLFLTYLCNATCSFCPSPHKDDRVWTEFGPNIEDLLDVLKDSEYQGIGFSGGDPFLVYPRLLGWLKTLHSHFPEYYYWVYTNGLAAETKKMEELQKSGMDEIRFNIAATGYDNPLVMERLRAATQIFEHVAVEIPSIPAHYDQLINLLPSLDEIGISYLNLHEFFVVADDNLSVNQLIKQTKFNFVNDVSFNADSKGNTEKLIAFCQQSKMNLKINSCTVAQKEQQMLHRRRAWASRVCQPWEQITESGLLATCARTVDLDRISERAKQSAELLSEELDLQHPESCKGLPEYQTIYFLPPMDVESKRVIIEMRGDSDD